MLLVEKQENSNDALLEKKYIIVNEPNVVNS